MTTKPLAILLCKFRDQNRQPQRILFYRDFFTEGGSGKGGAFDYWLNVSDASIDLTGSKVFGWFKMPRFTGDVAGLTFPQDRETLVSWGVESAKANGVDLSPFFGVIVILNSPTDHGAAGERRVVLAYGPDDWEPTFVLHEMGHLLGLDHSWSADPDTVYGDSWDLMSAMRVWKFAGNFDRRAADPAPLSGPGLNAHNLERLGSLPSDRVWEAPGQGGTQIVPLAALNHPEADGFLVARIPATNHPPRTAYTFEFRRKDEWDRGIPKDTVLAHEIRTNGFSYLLSTATGPELQSGQEFRADNPKVRIRVTAIEAASSRAVLEITWLLNGLLTAGDPAGYLSNADTPRVDYRGTDGHVHEIYIDENGQWAHFDLSDGANP